METPRWRVCGTMKAKTLAGVCAIEVVFVLKSAAADDVDIGRELAAWLLAVAAEASLAESKDLNFSAVWHVHGTQVVTVTVQCRRECARSMAALEVLRSALETSSMPSHLPQPLAVFVEPIDREEWRRSLACARLAATPARAALAECGWMQRSCKPGAPCYIRCKSDTATNESSAFAVCFASYDAPDAALARGAAKWVAGGLARMTLSVPGAWRCTWVADASVHIVTVVARFEAANPWELVVTRWEPKTLWTPERVVTVVPGCISVARLAKFHAGQLSRALAAEPFPESLCAFTEAGISPLNHSDVVALWARCDASSS
jgi:hypothetical protein